MNNRTYRTVKTRQSRAKERFGDVSNEQLRQDVEQGLRFFWGKPWRERPVPEYSTPVSKRSLRSRMGMAEAVRVAIKIGDLQRGALKRIADSNGLDYRCFTKAYYKARSTGRLPGGAPVLEVIEGRAPARGVSRRACA